MSHHSQWIAFAQGECLAKGAPSEVASAIKRFNDAEPTASILVFDAVSSGPVEIDLRGTVEEVLARLAPHSVPETRSVGRPKLGVVAKEITLLPRHWEWLASQSGGASVALRKLVEQAMRANSESEQIRKAQEATYLFIQAIAGNEVAYEEATRALFASDLAGFNSHMATWPQAIREHALHLAHGATS
ncbi:MAG: DUF2239 family protein [Thiofilum sp.]|uniref:DUF2239 family protein n=1 Tax=Thiofilum sp. TaxID=2212733 RepID=UPI0025CECECA|nr:DUF2239 family protein [Thiofilum sp.]MBK8454876.1 DUF2239 family protein [Thiofilum sp.]